MAGGVKEELAWGAFGLRRRSGDTTEGSSEESGLPCLCDPSASLVFRGLSKRPSGTGREA